MRVRFAKWDTRYLFVFDERNQRICTADQPKQLIQSTPFSFHPVS
ncbi:hypothetical protein [Metapseudomonas resinovorans]